MRSDYINIEKSEENYQFYLNYTNDESSVAVYLNGSRLFLNKDYTILNRTITFNVGVESDDRLIISHS